MKNEIYNYKIMLYTSPTFSVCVQKLTKTLGYPDILYTLIVDNSMRIHKYEYVFQQIALLDTNRFS